MDQPLNGQTVLILGGSGQMGSAIARASALQGAKLTLVGRELSSIQALAATLSTETTCLAADLNSPTATEQLFASLIPVQHLVIAVSANAHASSLTETAPADAQAAFAKFWITYYALHFGAAKVHSSGSITALSGSSARRPGNGFGIWTAVHGSIEALMRAAVLELAPVRINVVSPGGIGLKPDRQLIPHQGRADDIGQAVVSLLANDAITGAVLDVDSGERLGTWPE